MSTKVYFLGSNRLPHCGGGTCPGEVYYSGETIKFLIETTAFINYNQGYYTDENNYNYCSGNYALEGQPGYVPGMHAPLVYGSPKFRFKIQTVSGTQTRYATLNEEFSNVAQGYFQYDYKIQGIDDGPLSIESYYLIVSDPENRISYYTSCYGMFSGVGSGGSFDSEFITSYLTYDQYNYTELPDLTNVSINSDSGLVTENQTRILLKRSSVADKVPTTADLLLGEAAVNTTDGKIFLKKGDDSIVHIKPLEPQDFDTLSVAISADTNDLDLGIKALSRLSVSADGLKISGFKAGKDGEIKMVYNSGSYTVKILNESNNSLAANRVAVYNSADFDLPSRSGITIVYDGTSGVWRLF